MAIYFYQALSTTGKKITGQLDSSSEEAVRLELLAKKLYPIKITSQKEIKSNSLWTLLTEKPVEFKDLLFFTKQLGVLLKSSIPLVQALDLLSEQFKGALQTIIINTKDNIREGKSLSESLSQYPKTFSNIYIQLIKAGEATGKLDTILEKLTVYLERQEDVKKRVSGALSQPLFQLGVIVVITIAIMTLVVPRLQDMLKASKSELPGTTVALLAISHALLNHYIAIIGVLFFIVIAFVYWKSLPSGKHTLDKLVLKLPLIQYFAKTSAIVQFSSTLGMLLDSGVNLSEALDIVCNIIDNSVLVKTLEAAKDKIVKQGKMTPFLKETGIFPPMAIYLINTGEQSGNLGPMLLTVARNYEDELTELSDSLTEKITPVTTLLTGAIVGFIMYSVMSPIFNMYDISNM